jgi:hypothetical protein
VKPDADANDSRGFHFKRLILKPLTWALIVGFTILAGGLSVLFFGPVAGGVLAVIAFLLGPITVFAIADAKAGEDFFAGYAKSHGMTSEGRGPLPEAAPLLRRGSNRFAEHSLSGPLADGVEGTVALYVYERELNDSKGIKKSDRHRYTVGLVEVPESAERLPELYCRDRADSRRLEEISEGSPVSGEPLALESAALEERYEILAGAGQDQSWLRQLFAPTFIVWLTDSAPDGFAFELVDGALCCSIVGHAEDAVSLDTVRAATAAVATRLRDEALE